MVLWPPHRRPSSCRRRSIPRVVLPLLVLALLAGCLSAASASGLSSPGGASRTPAAGPAPTATPTPTPTPSPTPTPTPPPMVIAPGSGLFAQFGYSPPFTRNVPAFDASGRPYIRSRSADPDYTGFVNTWRDGTWVRLDVTAALRGAFPDYAGTDGGGGGPTARLMFDAEDRAYTVLTVSLQGGGTRNVMLWSTDHCATWRVADLPAGSIVPESFTGHNTFGGPPPLLVSTVGSDVSPDTGKLARELWFTRPFISGDTLIVPPLTLVSDRSLGLGDNATTASPMATHGDLTWIVYADTTPTPAQGSPVYVTTYDRARGVLLGRVLLAWAQPGNDGHAQPGIALDSQGYLHVIAGAHGRPFQYRRTLVPSTAYEGWSQLEPVCTTGYRENPWAPQQGCQTYLSFVIDAQDRPQIVFRQWRKNTDTWFGGALYGALSYQRRDPLLGWTEARPLVVPPYGGYSIWVQALTVGPGGRLFLSASCMAGAEGAERKAALARWQQAGGDGPQPPLYLRRFVLVSDDGGDTWRFATTDDLTAGITP